MLVNKFYKYDLIEKKTNLDGIITKAMIENAQNKVCTQEHSFEHFKSEGHGGFLGNVSITLIDKTDGKGPKRRENYLMKTLKTYAPFGINIENSV